MEIIAIDDDSIMLHTIAMVLEESFGEIMTLQHPDQMNELGDVSSPKVIILDLNYSTGDSHGSEGLAWVGRIKAALPNTSIIVLTAHGDLDVAVKCLKQGANDFLEKPFLNEKLIATVQAALNLANAHHKLKDAEKSRDLLVNQINRFNNIVIGPSSTTQNLMDVALKVANTDASVLITGEHGTGKEMIAQYIHQMSNRASQPFVSADLSAITPSLFESTLFGHVKGAFTDAIEDQSGMMEAANMGTLMLDEIGDITMQLQAKLLSVLQNRAISRVGENRTRAVDFRLICTTHKTLEDLGDPTLFRQDLLFRINTIHIEVPPLRHRRDDIQQLTSYFLYQFNKKYNRSLRLKKSQMDELKTYDWPGNVRELRNSIERMVILDSGNVLSESSSKKTKGDNLYELEKKKIQEVIERNSGNISRAANELGIGRNTLYRKMKKYEL